MHSRGPGRTCCWSVSFSSSWACICSHSAETCLFFVSISRCACDGRVFELRLKGGRTEPVQHRESATQDRAQTVRSGTCSSCRSATSPFRVSFACVSANRLMPSVSSAFAASHIRRPRRSETSSASSLPGAHMLNLDPMGSQGSLGYAWQPCCAARQAAEGTTRQQKTERQVSQKCAG